MKFPLFLESEITNNNYNDAKIVILPIPFENSTSYIAGAKEGPKYLLEASSQLEAYDDETNFLITDIPISTLAPIDFLDQNIPQELQKIYHKTLILLNDQKWPVFLGGEHTVTVPIIKAFKEYHKNDSFGVIHLDAHFDLRMSYENNINSHACILRRIIEMKIPTLSLGVRAFSQEEKKFANDNQIMYLTDYDLYTKEKNISNYLKKLPDKIYLTIDTDFFDVGIFPGVGTPVPGGPGWWDSLQIIKQIFKQKKIIGFDIVELCPKIENIITPFNSALLLQKCISYQFGNI